tara:strand:- start:208 stop:555 length:348 start_codon:yes stop_codon:yes gene_type:complete
MVKNKIIYSDLSPKELELLKDTYIDLKVKNMNINDLKEYVIENLSLQIKSTIGDDEELEAWNEMEEFFNDEFEHIIQDLQIKMRSQNGEHKTINTENLTLEAENKEKMKLDMWED